MRLFMRETFQLSPYQRTILDYLIAYPNTGIVNIGGLLKSNRRLSHEVMEKCFNLFLKNHETIRLQLSKEHELYVKEYEPFTLPLFDFSDKTKTEIKEIAQEWMKEPFSLFHSKFYWACMIKKEDDYYLFEKFHHLIWDGISSVVAIQYQENYYNQLLNQEPIGIKQTEDGFIRALREEQWYSLEQYETAKKWFLKQYKKMEPNWLLKQNSISPNAGYHSIKINQSLQQRVASYCKKNKITEEGFYYGILYTYIAKTKGIEEVVIGRVLAGRSRKEKDMLGMMVNTVPVKLTVQRNVFFTEVCEKIDAALIGTLRHGSFDLHSLLKECETKERIFDIAVSYRRNKYIPQTTFGTFEELFNGYLELPLRIFLNEEITGMEWILQFQKNCYTEVEIEYLENRIIRIMEQAVCNPIWNDINIFSENDSKRISQVNDTEKLIIEQTPTELFLKRVKEMPNKKALLYKQKAMTFQEVEENSKKIAMALQKKGVKEGDIVGLLMDRNIFLPISILAILRIGAAFLPINSKDHEKRLELIESNCKVVITDTVFQNKPKRLHYDTLLCYKGDIAYQDKDVNIDATAYLMYTSGTTGLPKAVEITRRSLICRLQWMWEQFPCDGIIMQKTVYTFDVSVWELLLPFLYGATMSILPEGEEKFPDKIVETIERHQVNVIHFVPSMLTAFMQYCKEKKKRLSMLNHILCSGETLHATQVEQSYQLFPQSTIYNLYGPTECTIDVTYHICREGEKEVPIGIPVANTKIYVCNQVGEELPLGMEGELVVAGDLVGKGYYGIQDNRYDYLNGERVYWTGDLVKRGFDGLLYYIGRKDSQCKLRGMRINLQAIEEIMLEAGTKEAVVLVKGQRLIAYYTAEKKLDTLWEKVNEKLPYYSVPSKFIRMEKMPIGKNGKLDRKALEETYVAQKERSYPANSKEAVLCSVIARQLKEAWISTKENLFEAGLDSLSILEIVNILEKEGISLSYMDFYQKPTVYQLANVCQRKKQKELQFLRRENNDTLILCIPYAGSGPEIFYPLVKEMQEMPIDMAGISFEQAKKNRAVDIGKKIAGQIQDYDKIYIIGYCVGSAAAIECTRYLMKQGKKIEGLMLCGTLPAKRNPWGLFNDNTISKILSHLHREKVSFSKKQIQWFREDTNRFFEYMKQKKQSLKHEFPVTLVFGEKDEITRNYRKRYVKWRTYLKGKYKIYQLKDAGHFFLKTHKKSIAYFIRNDLQ